MKRILITGATGNIGTEVIQALSNIDENYEIIAAVRNIEKAKTNFKAFSHISYRQFDFEDKHSFTSGFHDIDVLFLLRPPHISQVEKFFRPLLESAYEIGIRKIVFLSVQGADRSMVIPHNKIERLIQSLGFKYIFVRPGYFMQNLTTTLLPEILKSQSITLPSGNAKFNWIDTRNIGEVTAVLIISFEKYHNKAFDITGSENKNFQEVTDLMTEILGINFKFKSINPVSFYFKMKREGKESGFAAVMTILHFLPRIQEDPEISENYHLLTNRYPTTLKEFVRRERESLTSNQ